MSMPLENLQLYYTEGHAFVVHGGKKMCHKFTAT